jgi:hypothetical protein
MPVKKIKIQPKHVRRATGLKITPSLLLQGNELENAGFKPGTIAKVEIIKGKITITID